MILNRCECVIFDNPEQERDVLMLLEQHGYNTYNGIPPMCLDFSTPAIRWWWGGEFPNCLATFDNNMVRQVRETGRVGPDAHPIYQVVTYEEFMSRAGCGVAPEVGDLL